ncbi:MAG: hypothetical protein GY854_31610 [Deltaproteobacteria bacterium]|nr:hypothetical protein [Deltaproteobacteria bacterium]
MMMHYMKKKKTASIVLLLLASWMLSGIPASADSPDDILVIANKQVKPSSISMDELRELFLKQRTKWGGSRRITPINAKKGTALRKKFRKAVLQISAGAEQTVWEDQKIRKGIAAPPELKSTQKAAFRVWGGVSYVFRRDYDKNVTKILLVIPG